MLRYMNYETPCPQICSPKNIETSARGESCGRSISYSGKTSDLVPQALGGDDSNLLCNLLVSLEIIGETSVVLLHQNPSRLLYGLCPHTTLGEMNTS